MANEQIYQQTETTTLNDEDVAAFDVDVSGTFRTRKITKANLKTTLGVITTEQANAITANTAKNTYPSADATKLSGIEAGAEVNTIDSDTSGEISGSDQVLNVVSLTQAEYDAGTPISTTLYIITD